MRQDARGKPAPSGYTDVAIGAPHARKKWLTRGFRTGGQSENRSRRRQIMSTRIKTPFFMLGLGTLLIILGGCASIGSDPQTHSKSKDAPEATRSETKHAQAEPVAAETVPAQETPQEAAPTVAQPSAEDLKKKQDELDAKRKEMRKKDRQLAKLERNLETAQIKLDKTKLSHEHALLREQLSVSRREIELELARRRYDQFMQKSLPSRIAWSELGLLRVADNITEAREELEQLEMMYREDEVDEKTKEIVIGRSRVRLERSLRDQELRQADFDTLMNESIPIETREQELRLEDAEQTLERARESLLISELDRRINIIGAEDEITRIQGELEDAREEAAELKKQIEKLEAEIHAGGTEKNQ